MSGIAVGDYVLATKYGDGDPGDHFAVGFVVAAAGAWPRFDIVDGKGDLFRGNGFRRAEQITTEEGSWLVQNIAKIECGGASLWEILKTLRDD